MSFLLSFEEPGKWQVLFFNRQKRTVKENLLSLEDAARSNQGFLQNSLDSGILASVSISRPLEQIVSDLLS